MDTIQNSPRTPSTALMAAVLLALAIAPSAFAAPPATDAVTDRIKASDTNHDGMVSSAEHAAYAKSRYDAMDTDHNGQVTTAEMDAARKTAMKGKTPVMAGVSAATRIKTMDTNNDGMLSAEESATAAQQSFDQMDGNHDGQLSVDEMHVGHDAGMVSDSPLPDSN